LIDTLHQFKVKKIVGGPGAWQLLGEDIDVDTIVIGEGEQIVGELFEKALKNEPLPEVVEGDEVDVDKIPLIKRPSICGLVEIARGCGRGCRFCSPTIQTYRCRPIEDILKEIQIILDSGQEKIKLHSEDVLQYKSKGSKVNSAEVMRLFEAVGKRVKPENISMSHISLSSALAQPKLIEMISEYLKLGSKENPWLSPQTGIETASGALIKKHMPGKALPFKPEQWKNVVCEAFQLLHENNWVPCATLIMGLPDETEKNVIETIELVEKLKDYKSLIIPLFFVPVEATRLKREEGFTRHKMTLAHWALMAKCSKNSTYWIKILAKDALKKSKFFAKYGMLLIAHLWEGFVNPYMDQFLKGEIIFPNNRMDMFKALLFKKPFGYTPKKND